MNTDRVEHEKKLFKRLIISDGDLDHAGWFADIILNRHLHSCTDEESKYLHRGLNLALVVTYCRPFSGNKCSNDTTGDLPGRYLRDFSKEERALHSHLLKMRNCDHAHSTAAGHAVEVTVDARGAGPVAWAISRNAYVPLPREDTERLRGMITKLIQHVMDEHIRIQRLLAPGEQF
ncbi:MAG: hypothetical protein ACHQ9S_22690 [Candidatus Binatia bacterium]